MRYFIYGADANVDPEVIHERLNKYISVFDELYVMRRPGINSIVIDYAKDNGIRVFEFDDITAAKGLNAHLALVGGIIGICDKVLFFFTKNESPDSCYLLPLALEIKITDQVFYEFI